ncbi:MAG: beta-lactamase family protein [Acidobacteria bacterium]|nr:beta-lactamase family protein [Acidobacteriota bacterium]
MLRACAVGLLVLGWSCGQSEDRFTSVREKIRTGLEEQHVSSLAIAVAQGGEIVWEEGFGLADRERNVRATPHTAYSLASISKPITATGLMRLVERGEIALDSPANDYLGEGKIRGRAADAAGATVARVASHSAGLPLHYQFFLEGENYPRPSMDETIAHYANLVTQPGEKYQYSNLGFGIVDHIIERAAGKPYPQYMREEVFEPLGMEHTAIPVSSQDFDSGREWAVRYWDLETPLPFYDFDHRGGSAVYSCAHDLVRFGMSHLGQTEKSVLSAESIAKMQQPIADVAPGSGYGLGWRIDEDRMGVRTVSHTGGMGGVATSLVLAPEHGLVVVVLTNASSGLAHEISHETFAALIPEYRRRLEASRNEQPKDAKPAGELPADLQGVWQGQVETYQAALPFRLEIVGANEARASLGGNDPTALREISFEDGYLTAKLVGDIGTPDANRREYDLSLNVKLRGHKLNGCLTAVGKPSPKLPNAVTSWIELAKE